jgi:hypothetical protein
VLYRLSYVSSDVVIRIWSIRIKFRKRSVHGAAMERETGIEPAPSAWKAEVLPLNYSRILRNGLSSAHSGDERLERGGGRWIRTTEGVSQQIYSLPPLAAWVSLRLNNVR